MEHAKNVHASKEKQLFFLLSRRRQSDYNKVPTKNVHNNMSKSEIQAVRSLKEQHKYSS